MTRRRVTTAALAAISLAAFAGLSGSTQARSRAARTPMNAGLRLAITGTTDAGTAFTGTFTLQRFAARGDVVVAVGFIQGSAGLTPSTILRGPVELPVTIGAGAAAAGASARQTAGAGRRLLVQAQTCPVLHLDLGAVNLDLLGLQVTTAPIVIDIVASGGGTDVLGSLICTVLETVANVIAVVDLLNNILGLVTGLLGGLTGGLAV
jgi:hypothetical protein